jgi:hypothetical protein
MKDEMGKHMLGYLVLASARGLRAAGARWTKAIAGAAIAACAGSAALAEGPAPIPDLGSSNAFAWTPLTINGGIARYGTGWFDPPAPLRGPIKQHPDYPLRGNETRRPTPALGNWADPILKPWGGGADAPVQ